MDEAVSFHDLDQKITNPHPKLHTEIQLTPEEANYITTRFRYPRQRKLRESWAIELGILIDKNELQATSIHFAHCKETGEIYLVDGYHRLKGLSLASKPYLFPATHHYCLTLEEVNDVYSKLDQGVSRRMGDAIRAHDIGAKLGIPEVFLERVAAAVQVLGANFRTVYNTERLRSSSERIHLVEEWHKEASLIHQEMSGGNTEMNKKLINSAFLGVLLAISRYQPEKARTFIYGVSHIMGEDGSATKAMVSAIFNRGNRWGRNVAEQSRVMASAWNYHYEGKALTMAVCRDAAIPIDILGTPWAGPATHTSGPNIQKIKQPYEQRFRKAEPKLGVEPAEGVGK